MAKAIWAGWGLPGMLPNNTGEQARAQGDPFTPRDEKAS